ncbi:flagellar biosynthetic protein FliR [Zavarzinella formosa]|uniref:flagellar biosynthetic protein FliR n=1 Tax=Zavarzinella formosa TaxID=360055 RepID=UPI000318B492|nr:flagellar biosynthetic protein FliR [Zavarzinella formosa]
MTPALAAYIGLVLARVGAFVAVMPLFSGRTPQTVRAALAIALTAFFLAQVTPAWDGRIAGQNPDIPWLMYSIAMIRETILGAGMGFAFGLFLLPPRIAGEFLTTQIGLALSPQSGISGDQPAGPLTLAFEAAGSLMFFELDGHHFVLMALHASFAKLPLGGDMLPQIAGPALQGLSASYEQGMMLAAPLGMCLFLLAVVLAIMARAAPQLNIYSVGFTLQVFVALAGSFLLMSDMLGMMAGHLGRIGASLNAFME